MSNALRAVLVFAAMAVLLVGVGFSQSWSFHLDC